MSDDPKKTPGPRGSLAKSRPMRSIGFLSHTASNPDIPRGPDGAPRKARGIRSAEATHDPQAQQLESIPVKPYSMKTPKVAKPKATPSSFALHDPAGKKKP